jgi:membrane associated rhomboid family serine protease
VTAHAGNADATGASGPMTCRTCSLPLRRLASVTALRAWACPSCRGAAAAIASLLPTIPGGRAARLEAALGAAAPKDRTCPACATPMRRAAVDGRGGPFEIDGCLSCRLVWLDPGELGRLRGTGARPAPRPVAQKSAIERLRDEAKAAEDDVVAALLGVILGIPYPEPVRAFRGRPLLTWTLCAVTAVASIAAFADLDAASRRFGMIPDEVRAGRLSGLVTHFFVHVDLFHLAGNLLFLLLFGARTEAVVGRPRAAFIVLAATVAGALAHATFTPDPTLPLIGASGGVSGVLAAHACLRPHSKVRVMRYFRMVTISAPTAFAIWIALQLIGTAMQFTGVSAVSALAHLGGAAAGLAVASFFRGRARRVEPRPA